MKVDAYLDHHVEVDVTWHDIMTELSAMPVPERGKETLQLISRCVGGLRNVPAECLADLTPLQRGTIIAAIQIELDRLLKSGNVVVEVQ